MIVMTGGSQRTVYLAKGSVKVGLLESYKCDLDILQMLEI